MYDCIQLTEVMVLHNNRIYAISLNKLILQLVSYHFTERELPFVPYISSITRGEKNVWKRLLCHLSRSRNADGKRGVGTKTKWKTVLCVCDCETPAYCDHYYAFVLVGHLQQGLCIYSRACSIRSKGGMAFPFKGISDSGHAMQAACVEKSGLEITGISS